MHVFEFEWGRGMLLLLEMGSDEEVHHCQDGFGFVMVNCIVDVQRDID